MSKSGQGELDCRGICLGSSGSNRELFDGHEKTSRAWLVWKRRCARGLKSFVAGVGYITGGATAVTGRRLLIVAQCVLEVIAFASSGFEIEHQILHVHPKLAESLLD